ncbi:MAG: prolyl oligopeptidase family serine peptidase [Ferruginibacter sp.]
MNRKKLFIALIACSAICFSSCQKEDSIAPINGGPSNYVKGKNRFVTKIDGDDREYYVHVPQSYTGNSPVPAVFMLHGTSGDGEDFYTRSGWRQVGEDENIITVFPSSWRYCINDNGEIKNTTKWNTPPDADWTFCPGQTPRNDIKFLSTIITELNAKFKIDNKRIYLSGFSNGGQMAAKCVIELSDRFAAIVENAGSFYIDTMYTPKRKLPVLFQKGNEDYGPGNTGQAIPLSLLDTILKTPGLPYLAGSINRVATSHIKYLGLNPGFTLSGDTNSVVVATYKSLSGGPDFRLSFVKNLAHVYPNGDNHWMEAARVQWAWFKQYSMP